MTAKSNLAASVHQRLLNRAKKEGRPFNELLQYYVLERFLYRLGKSAHAERYVLKGALLMLAWRAPAARPTMDIDLLGKVRNDEAGIARQMREVIQTEVPPDGLDLLPDSVRTEHIAEDAEYRGVRVLCLAKLGNAKVPIQVDIGFGDVVYPGPVVTDLPGMLDFEAPRLLCYSLESAIAEKFEAMVSLGHLNSRMKDFYDIWMLAQGVSFEADRLVEAVRRTFTKRKTDLSGSIEAFDERFCAEHQPQWSAFVRRLRGESVPGSLADIVGVVAVFLGPVAEAVSTGKHHLKSWKAPGPWR